MKKGHDKQQGLADRIDLLPYMLFTLDELLKICSAIKCTEYMYTIYAVPKIPNDPSGQPWDLYENLRQSAQQRRVPDVDADAEGADKLVNESDRPNTLRWCR